MKRTLPTNRARYRLAQTLGEPEVWIEVEVPDDEGNWHPHRALYHVLELAPRYGDPTWSRASIEDDGSAKIRRGDEWHVWRPHSSAGPIQAALLPGTRARASRCAAPGRRQGSRRTSSRSSGSGDPDLADLADDDLPDLDACLLPGSGGVYELSEYGVRGPLTQAEAIRLLDRRALDLLTDLVIGEEAS